MIEEISFTTEIIKIKEGSTYLNTTDNKAYKYINGQWVSYNDLELDEVSDATLITNLQNKIIDLEIQLDIYQNPIYCPNCNSCGEEGCCAIEKCKTFQLKRILDNYPWHNLHCSTMDWENFKTTLINQFRDGLYCEDNNEKLS